MTRFAVCAAVLFMLFIAGCVPSGTQHKNVMDAINDKPILTGYTRDYIINKFGPPDEIIAQPSGGKHAQLWVYKRSPEKPDITINFKPDKTKETVRYMKLLLVGGAVLDSSYE